MQSKTADAGAVTPTVLRNGGEIALPVVVVVVSTLTFTMLLAS